MWSAFSYFESSNFGPTDDTSKQGDPLKQSKISIAFFWTGFVLVDHDGNKGRKWTEVETWWIGKISDGSKSPF